MQSEHPGTLIVHQDPLPGVLCQRPPWKRRFDRRAEGSKGGEVCPQMYPCIHHGEPRVGDEALRPRGYGLAPQAAGYGSRPVALQRRKRHTGPAKAALKTVWGLPSLARGCRRELWESITKSYRGAFSLYPLASSPSLGCLPTSRLSLSAVTCVYTWVVARELCPRSSCIALMSTLFSSMWVAKVCLRT